MISLLSAVEKIVKALYDYDPLQNDELGFKNGDKLHVKDFRFVQ